MLAAFPAVSFGSLSYTLVGLDHSEAVEESEVAGLSDAGEVLVNPQRIDIPGQKKMPAESPYLWQEGREEHPFPGTMTAISHQGWIAGTLQSGDAEILKPSGKTQVLSVTGNEKTFGIGVFALNDSDQAVGYGVDSTTIKSNAYYWDHGQFHNLGNFGGDARAIRINDDSQILIDRTINDVEGALLWQNGKSVSIKVPTGDSLLANDLNEHGEVVGGVYQNDAPTFGFSWKNGVMQELPPLPGDKYTWASGVNDLGEIVGTSWSDGQPHTPVMWENGEVINLLPDIAVPQGWTFLQPTEINNEGLIAGEGYLHFSGPFDTQQRAFLLTPNQSATAIPLPLGVWLGCTAAPLLMWQLRRK